MLERFYPRMTVDRVQDIDLEVLEKNNIKGLILDIDNTLVPMHVKDADQNAVKWIEKVKNSPFRICIVSNASEKRVVRFNERLKVFAIHRANKPGTTAFLKAAALMQCKPEEVAVIGDQLFTDIYGGNKSHMYTILVNPIDKREILFVRMKRLPEKIILKKYKSK